MSKKRIIASATVTILCMVFATATTSMGFAAHDQVENVMAIGRESVAITEEYVQPQPLYPGDEVRKVVSFTNTGDIDSLIRVRYDELWTAKAGEALPTSVLVENEIIQVTVKNWTDQGLPNASVWSDGGDGYYYYNRVLRPLASTDPVLASIGFNRKMLRCPDLLRYADADYNLTFSVESVAASVDETALRNRFGSQVSATVSDSGTVTWKFITRA